MPDVHRLVLDGEVVGYRYGSSFDVGLLQAWQDGLPVRDVSSSLVIALQPNGVYETEEEYKTGVSVPDYSDDEEIRVSKYMRYGPLDESPSTTLAVDARGSLELAVKAWYVESGKYRVAEQYVLAELRGRLDGPEVDALCVHVPSVSRAVLQQASVEGVFRYITLVTLLQWSRVVGAVGGRVARSSGGCALHWSDRARSFSCSCLQEQGVLAVPVVTGVEDVPSDVRVWLDGVAAFMQGGAE